MNLRRGFTLIEIMITLGIIAILGIVAIFNLQGGSGVTSLTDATKQIATLLRQAQSDSMAQERGASWGVYFDNTNPNSAFYSLFYTTNGSYTSSTQSNQYLLPSKICYATSSVATGASTTIIFNPLSGAPSASATITLDLTTGGCAIASSTGAAGGISRSGSGKIFFDDFSRSNL